MFFISLSRKVRVVVRVCDELLDLVLELANIQKLVTGKQSVGRVDLHDDDVTLVDASCLPFSDSGQA